MTKKGKTKAIIPGIEDFLQAVVKTPKSLAVLQEQVRKSGTEILTPEAIEAEIAAFARAMVGQRHDAQGHLWYQYYQFQLP